MFFNAAALPFLTFEVLSAILILFALAALIPDRVANPLADPVLTRVSRAAVTILEATAAAICARHAVLFDTAVAIFLSLVIHARVAISALLLGVPLSLGVAVTRVAIVVTSALLAQPGHYTMALGSILVDWT